MLSLYTIAYNCLHKNIYTLISSFLFWYICSSIILMSWLKAKRFNTYIWSCGSVTVHKLSQFGISFAESIQRASGFESWSDQVGWSIREVEPPSQTIGPTRWFCVTKGVGQCGLPHWCYPVPTGHTPPPHSVIMSCLCHDVCSCLQNGTGEYIVIGKFC